MKDLFKQNKELRNEIKQNQTTNTSQVKQQIKQNRNGIINLRNQNKDLKQQINNIKNQILNLIK